MLTLYRSDLNGDVANMAGRVLRAIVEQISALVDVVFPHLIKMTMKVSSTIERRSRTLTLALDIN